MSAERIPAAVQVPLPRHQTEQVLHDLPKRHQIYICLPRRVAPEIQHRERCTSGKCCGKVQIEQPQPSHGHSRCTAKSPRFRQAIRAEQAQQPKGECRKNKRQNDKQ